MKIFSAKQIRAWDQFTISEQQITSAALMEGAAMACYTWLLNHDMTNRPIMVFCGKGNNGGDGLALVRILLNNNIPATAYILETGKPGTEDFQRSLQQLHIISSDIHFLQSDNFFPVIGINCLVIDALFGTGLNKPLDGMARQLANHINKSGANVIAIDVPSGLFIDKSSKGHTVVQATHTLAFQQMKLAFLMPENHQYTGEFHLLPIGLSEHFEMMERSRFEMVTPELIRYICRPIPAFAHKGERGHAAIVSGSFGMMGASVLAAKGCLHSGVGKLTCHTPACGYQVMQVSVPEAMCKVSGENHPVAFELSDRYSGIGVGPGIGTNIDTKHLLMQLLTNVSVPLVLDADALNILATDTSLLHLLPAGTTITPHIGEFERLFGQAPDDFQRLETAIDKASAHQIYIILKGHYTAVITPGKMVYFNGTGNAGMAKAGMGDVLTGILTGLISQRYSLPEAALLGVYLHGLAGDIAAANHSQQAMQASQLADSMQEAWKTLIA